MITERLAEFVADTRTSDLPEAALDAATEALIDTLGVALAGSCEPVADIALAWVEEIGARPQVPLWGRAISTHVAEAAFANGISAHALDFDDTHPSARGHMSTSLIPTALAVGQMNGASGREVLAAYVLGLEVAGAFGRAFGPGHLKRGWHPTATVGALATTAVAARLSGLDALGIARAWGLAGSQIGGLARNFGTMAKPFHAGHAARIGVLSAWMVKHGLTAQSALLDGARGILDTYSGGDGESIEAILAALGNPWEILSPGNYFKGWPCCYSGHRTLAMLYSLVDKHGIAADEVSEVSVSFLPGGDTALVSREPKTGLEGKFSIEYMVAAALLDGPVGMANFTDPMVQRPAAQDFMRKVRRVPIPDEKFYSGITGYNDISVTTPRGTFAAREDRVPGSLLWPISERDRDAKFMDCATLALEKPRAEALLETLKHAKSATRVADFVELATA
jgi:2-methylcitrate dehydratase PrpD